MSVKLYQTVTVILTYWVLSISTTFVNSYLVGQRDTKTNLTVFIGWVQCCVTVTIILLGLKLKRALDPSPSPKAQLIPFSLALKKEVLLMTVTFVGMISFNNCCLQMVGVAFFSVARSTTLIFTVLLTTVFLGRSVSWKVVSCCAAVAVGFLLGVDQEQLLGTLSPLGVGYGVATSVFASIHTILTKKCLSIVNHDALLLAFLLNLNAILFFIPVLCCSGQWVGIYSLWSRDEWVYSICLPMSGLFACSMAWITARQIGVTSPITHHISGMSKSVLQTLAAVLYFNDAKPVFWWLSVALTVCGASSYAIVRTSEQRLEEAKADLTRRDKLDTSKED